MRLDRILPVVLAAASLLVPSAAVGARRDHAQILAALSPRFAQIRAPYSCVRLPNEGPEAIVVVLRSAYVRRARVVLRAAGVVGRVEVRPGEQYPNEILVLGREIELEAPAFPHKPNSAFGISGAGRGECPRVVIEIAPRGEAVRAEEAWAQSEIERYGSDRIAYTNESVGIAA